MSTINLYASLPKVPASANLPKKPDSQSTPFESKWTAVSESPMTTRDLHMNAYTDGPVQRPTAPRTPPCLPSLSSSTKDILARVHGTQGNAKLAIPETGSFRGANSTSSTFHTYQNAIQASSSTLNRPATESNLSVLRAASALPSVNIKKVSGEAPSTETVSSGESHNHAAKPQAAATFTSISQTSGDLQVNSRESTINVESTHNPQGLTMPVSELPRANHSSSRRQREYVLQDGTVVNSGKGLGRGRPGIKRGPRKPKLIPTSATPLATPPPAASSGPSKKRKRSSLKEEEEGVRTRVSLSEDDDSENYTPKATHTRSGRSTQQRSGVVPLETPVAKRPRLSTGPSGSQSKSNLIKKKIYRGREHNALCERCLRGRGPVDNAIVFCDGCNLCWHQKCHDPRIPKELVLDAKAEWFCKDCLSKLQSAAIGAETTPEFQKGKSATTEASRSTPSLSSSIEQSVPSRVTNREASAPSALAPLVGARSLTVAQRQQYLSTLSRQQLLDLVLHVSSIAPDLPIFPAPAAPPSTSVRVSTPLSRFTSPLPATTTTPLPLSTTTAGPSPSPGAPTTTTTNNTNMKPPPPPPPAPAPPTPLITTTTTTAPTTSPNPNLNPSRAAKALAPKYTSPSSPSSDSDSADASEPEDEREEYFEEEDYTPSHAQCYPKPGQGVMATLPPDKADEHILLEGQESRTFSHSCVRVVSVH